MTKNWIPRGIAFCEFEQEFQTESFTFVLLPEFSMNAFSSAVEPLRLANQLTGKEIFHWRCVSEDGQPVECSNGVTVGVNGTMEDISATDAVLVCSGVNPEKMLRERSPTTSDACGGKAKQLAAYARAPIHWRKQASCKAARSHCIGKTFSRFRSGILSSKRQIKSIPLTDGFGHVPEAAPLRI